MDIPMHPKKSFSKVFSSMHMQCACALHNSSLMVTNRVPCNIKA